MRTVERGIMAQRATLYNAAYSSQPAVLSQLSSLCPGAAALLRALVLFPCPLQPAQQQQGPGAANGSAGGGRLAARVPCVAKNIPYV